MTTRGAHALAAVAAAALTVAAPAFAAGEIQLLLVVDRSGSMAQPEGNFARIDWVKNGVLSAINELPADARMGIIAFDAAPELVMPMQTYDRFDIQRALDRLVPAGGNDLLAALELAESVLAAEGPGERLVIVLTDGVAPADYGPVAEAFRDAGIVVHPTVLGATGDFALRELAATTGGRFEAFIRFDILDALMRTEVLDFRDAIAAR